MSSEDLAHISALFKPKVLKKGDFFLQTGGYSNQLGFVQSGLLREFVRLDDKEVTKWISTKGYFAVDLASFIFKQPARWHIQALTECELYVIEASDYQNIGNIVPRWLHLEKLFIAKCFTVLEDRVLQHLSRSAEERYEQLFQFNQSVKHSPYPFPNRNRYRVCERTAAPNDTF